MTFIFTAFENVYIVKSVHVLGFSSASEPGRLGYGGATWQAMCQHAWVLICVGNGSSQPVRRRRRGEQERKIEWEEMRERRRRKERKKRKKRKEKEADGVFLSSLTFRRSKLVGPRSKVRRFDEGQRFER